MSTYAQYVADGATQLFNVSFPYLERAHVRVYRNGTLMVQPLDYEWQSNTQVRFRVAPILDSLVLLQRHTEPDNALVTYQNAAVLTADDLNIATLQTLFRTQELQDELNNYLTNGVIRFAAEGTPGSLTPSQLIESVTQEVLASELAAELQSRIGDIDLNGEAIVEQTLRVDGIFDLHTDNAAAIVTEQNVRAGADTALASDITTLQSTVGGHTTSISTHASTIDGIQGKYAVKVDNNGYISGFGLISTANNGTVVSEFIVLADKFAVITPGGSPVVPFVVSGGVTYLQSVVVGSTIRQGQTAFDTGTGFWLGDVGGTPKFSLGNASGNKVTWNGSVLSVTGSLNMTNSVATFTPTWTGFSSSPSGNISYLDLGAVVFLWVSTQLTGTSDATGMTITNLPAAIRPASGDRYIPCQLVDDNTALSGAVRVENGGTMTFYMVQQIGSTKVGPVISGFTASGVKGFSGGFIIMYSK